MDQSGGGMFGGLFMIIWLAIMIGVIAGGWKMFTKAGKPGWGFLIPIYNVVLLLEIIGRPIWWIILLIIPIVNLIIVILMCIDLAKSFGKGAGFGIGLCLLGFIFIPILGFGDATYQGPAASS